MDMNLKEWRCYSFFNPAQRAWIDPDTGSRGDQDDMAKIRGLLWALDLGKSGLIISGSLQSKEVLGDTWILSLIITIFVFLGLSGLRNLCWRSSKGFLWYLELS